MNPKHCLAALGIALALLTPSVAPALQPGDVAPPLELPGPTAAVSLAALRGQVVYVDFWASWCGPCKLSFPWMNELHARHQADGLRIVAVSLDARRADAERFLAEQPAAFAIAFDTRSDTPYPWGVNAMPTSVLIGRDGRVLWTHRGFKPEDRGALAQRIAAAVAAR